MLRRSWTSPHRSATTASSTSSTTSARLRALRRARSRSRSAASRTRRSRSVAPRPTSSASGESRWPTCAARSSGSTASPRGRVAPTCRGSGSPSARSSPRPTSSPGRRPRLRRADRGHLRLEARCTRRFGAQTPQNVGSQRALDFANRKELYDRALWTRTAAVTNAAGASTALVGSAETVAAAILDYVDLGADLVSIRGYDTLNDAVDYGRYVLPLVRQETRAPRGDRPARHAAGRPPRRIRDGGAGMTTVSVSPITLTVPDVSPAGLKALTAEVAATAERVRPQRATSPCAGLEAAHRAGCSPRPSAARSADPDSARARSCGS